MQKIATRTISTAFVLAMLLALNTQVSNASSYSAIISSTGSIKADSLKLNISSSQLADKKVNIKIQINNKDTDGTSVVSKTLTLDEDGKTTIKLSSLESGTTYGFRVKIKKNSESSYSSFSDEVTATTKGSKYTPKINSVKSVKDTYLTLSISCSQLKKKKVDVKVRVKNNDSLALTTKTATLTLDKKGKNSIKITGLDSGTEYAFKIQIKKSGASSYSVYSNEKTVQTKG
jgi:hypothetical protein